MRNSYNFAHRPDAWAFGTQDTFTTGDDRDAMMRRAQALRDAQTRRDKLAEAIQRQNDSR